MNNLLMVPVLKILRASPGGISEYQLMSQLEFGALQASSEAEVTGDLLLFRKHFLLMNALYRLQPILWEEGNYLRISALHIEIQAAKSTADSGLPCDSAEQKLRDYYLDWSHYRGSDQESVETLLNGFWQRYYAEDQQMQALAVMGLKEGCGWSQIRRAWRQLAALHHPDRGGDPSRFRQVREAYELLACSRN